MNDGQIEPVSEAEKITPTYKRYAKRLGKLFWEKDSQWDHEKNDYVSRYYLVMVSGLDTRWNGRYRYQVTVLDKAELEYRKATYNMAASQFDRYVALQNFVELDKANPVPPVADGPRKW